MTDYLINLIVNLDDDLLVTRLMHLYNLQCYHKQISLLSFEREIAKGIKRLSKTDKCLVAILFSYLVRSQTSPLLQIKNVCRIHAQISVTCSLTWDFRSIIRFENFSVCNQIIILSGGGFRIINSNVCILNNWITRLSLM